MLSPISLFVAGIGLGGGLFGVTSTLYHKWAQSLIVNAFAEEKRTLLEENANRKTVAFSALFEGFLGGAATLDDQGRILRSNRALHERLGYDKSELHGRSLLNIVHPEDMVPMQDFLLSLVGKKTGPATSPHFSSELRCYTKAGKIVWVHLSLSVLHDADFAEGSETPRLLALLDDVTRRRQVEGVVARLSAGVNELYRLISDQQSDFDTQMQALLHLGCHLFDVRTGILGKFNGKQLEIMSAISPNKGLRHGNSYEMGNAKQRTELPATLRASRIGEWHEQPFLTATHDETFLGAPIYVAGQLSGLLCFSDTSTRETPFEAEQTQFCQLMALWIGSEIERRDRQAQKARQDAALRQSNAKWEAMATQDGLTGLKNRRAFDERLQAEFNRASQGTVPLSLMLMDVDKFKHFNDTFGHPAGDEVLKQVGRLLQGGVRAGGFVARYGGEEFVVLLPDTSIEDALVTAERLRAIIEGGHWPQRAVTVSIGVASWVPGMTATGELVSAADGALYESKGGGTKPRYSSDSSSGEIGFCSGFREISECARDTQKVKRIVRWVGGLLLIAVPVVIWWAAWRAASWRPHEIMRIENTGRHFLTLSPQNHFLIAGREVWDLDRHLPVRSLTTEDGWFAGFYDETSYWSDDGLVKGSYRSEVISRRDVRSGRMLWHATVTVPAHRVLDDSITLWDIHLSPDFRYVRVISHYFPEHWNSRYLLSVFDAQTGQSLGKHVETKRPCFLINGGRYLATSYAKKTVEPVCALPLSMGKPLWVVPSIPWPDDDKVGVSPDGRIFWTMSDDRTHLIFLDARTGEKLWRSTYASDADNWDPMIVFSPDGRTVGVPNWTGILVFDALSGRLLCSRVIPNLRFCQGMQLENDGNALYTLETDGRVLRWRLR